MLRLSRTHHLAIVAHALDGVPEEVCGLLAAPAGSDGGDIAAVYPCRNIRASAKVYEPHPLDVAAADDDAGARGLTLTGVYHSHTHTDAWPSPTDVAEAGWPDWHFVIVSLRHPEPVLRSFRIVAGEVTEEPVEVEDH
ncbi:MAG TPA: M67 family metallopeptidase [Acidimicrobiales bacterium]|jgi:[CysO sulfur-carrier protein]-S-L-cysteine hydrolase|nr:M67 family metallopeptidase [Acidimicrobiales bacterium]